MNFSAMQSFLDSISELYGIPGGSIRIWQDHSELYRHDFGIRDIDTGAPMQGDEVTDLFSATKPITATAAMQLVEQGRLGLNDPVSLYIPEFAHLRYRDSLGELRPIPSPLTIYHLFTMTGGFTYDALSPAVRRVWAEKGDAVTTGDVVRAYAESPLAFIPGTAWRYSECLDILAYVVEVVSGMRFADYVKQNIFDPLGMTKSSFHLNKRQEPYYVNTYNGDPATGYTKRVEKGSAFRLSEHHDSGGGGLISCADDYIRFVDALSCEGMAHSGRQILTPPAVRLMYTNAVTNEQRHQIPWDQLKGYGYGLGVRTLVDPIEGGSLSPIGEFGWDGLKGAYLICDTTHHLSLFYFEQTGRYKEQLHPRLRNLLYSCMAAK